MGRLGWPIYDLKAYKLEQNLLTFGWIWGMLVGWVKINTLNVKYQHCKTTLLINSFMTIVSGLAC